MNDAYLLTGGNIGNRLVSLQQACMKIEKQAGIVLQKSAVYETAAWGVTDQNLFLNQVLLVSTSLPPEELLHTLLHIEQELGRRRIVKMGPRIIDIDILFYNNEIISTPVLTVPHPQIANRRFVLTPLNEIAPCFVHPVLQKTITELLEICPDEL
ncbi:MAG TPA: 2-amino-4-hydroxy-6-hydroxymethyldihydropteridine diphosphokinase, partial [Segetibacter sp.]|nr:2-amino-4-hydroxy-6-hydroxymethyldihydropteridine diphosphokinase [Segetibacter sp.]